MKTLAWIVTMIMLAGCAGMVRYGVSQVPTAELCQHVNYVRHGNHVTVTMDCQL